MIYKEIKREYRSELISVLKINQTRKLRTVASSSVRNESREGLFIGPSPLIRAARFTRLCDKEKNNFRGKKLSHENAKCTVSLFPNS